MYDKRKPSHDSELVMKKDKMYNARHEQKRTRSRETPKSLNTV